jgi:hypothetical protein
MKATELIYEELKLTFRYEDGQLYRLISEDNKNRKWKKFRGTWIDVDISKANTSKGYVTVKYKKSMLLAHRVIYCLHHKTDVDTSLVIDHENGIRHDNRPENIRLVTQEVNSNNTEKRRKGEIKGCCFFKRANKWVAQITVKGKQKSLGYFSSEQEAHEAYLATKVKIEAGEPVINSADRKRDAGRLKGASYDKKSKAWRAYIWVSSKLKHLGLFATELEAHQAYLDARTALGVGHES